MGGSNARKIDICFYYWLRFFIHIETNGSGKTIFIQNSIQKEQEEDETWKTGMAEVLVEAQSRQFIYCLL